MKLSSFPRGTAAGDRVVPILEGAANKYLLVSDILDLIVAGAPVELNDLAKLATAIGTQGGQIASASRDSDNRDTDILRGQAAASIPGENYEVFNTFAEDGRHQIVSVRYSDCKTTTFVNDNDDVVSGPEKGGLIRFSRPNGQNDSNGVAGREPWFVPAEGGTAYPLISKPSLWAIGESTTQGGSYATAAQSIIAYLAEIYGYSRVDDGLGGAPVTVGSQPYEAINDGLGSQDSAQEAARVNAGDVFISLPGNVVPASGTVSIGSSDISLDLLWNFASAYVPTSRPMYAGSVPGTLTRLTGGAKGAGNYTWTRTTPGATEPFGPGGRVRMNLDAYSNHTLLAWMGRNDDLTQLATTRARIAAVIAQLTPLLKHVLVLGLHTMTNGSEAVGSAACTAIVAHNAALSATYGARFFDVRDYLVNHAIDDAVTQNILPARTSAQIAADNAAKAAGNIPPSLTGADGLHLLPFTNKLIAQQLAGRMAQLGWGNP